MSFKHSTLCLPTDDKAPNQVRVLKHAYMSNTKGLNVYIYLICLKIGLLRQVLLKAIWVYIYYTLTYLQYRFFYYVFI